MKIKRITIKILMIALFLIFFTFMQPICFSGLEMLPDSYAIGVIFVLIDSFIFFFIPYKIIRFKGDGNDHLLY